MHILILDDDPDITTMLSTVVRVQGHTAEVLESAGPDSASALLARVAHGIPKADALVLDYMMPGINGDDVLSALDAATTGIHLPVLLYSAVDEQTLARVQRQHPLVRVLRKGTSIKELIPALRDLLAACASQPAR